MIRITGDTHGDRVRMEQLLSDMKPGDTLIVCGDFGFLFLDNDAEGAYLDRMEASGVTVCFVDGNHENFDAIYAYPVSERCGGRVHCLRPHVWHLMRGEIFTFEGHTFFVFGGAYSMDRARREEHVSWWREEIPTGDEYRRATENLLRYGGRVDCVLTHTAPRELIRRMRYEPDLHDIELTGFLEWIMYTVSYRAWYFGHWHDDRALDDKHRLLLFDTVDLPPKES